MRGRWGEKNVKRTIEGRKNQRKGDGNRERRKKYRD